MSPNYDYQYNLNGILNLITYLESWQIKIKETFQNTEQVEKKVIENMGEVNSEEV